MTDSVTNAQNHEFHVEDRPFRLMECGEVRPQRSGEYFWQPKGEITNNPQLVLMSHHGARVEDDEEVVRKKAS